MNQEIIGSAGIFIRSYFENTVLAFSDDGSRREGLQSNMVIDIGAVEMLARLKGILV